ncbi:MAG: hypothetical protein JOZ84_09450 [Methylobacteriaceae bacterium]|nr:hypothetical protein [Methylobacteriaceae bacterium]
MAEFRIDEEDAILPVRITHKCEQIWSGKALEQEYNYLVYDFETEQHLYHARAYLKDIRTVSVYGPFAKNSDRLVQLEGIAIDQRVLAYLRRRYCTCKRSVQVDMCLSSDAASGWVLLMAGRR